MSELAVYNHDGKEVGKVHLKEELWHGEIHQQALYLGLKKQLSSKRTGTHDTKTRSEVSGTGKKPWKQKGSGRARSGSVRSPLWRHGGVIFGPHPRKHGFFLPQQVRQLALRSALRNLVQNHRLIVVEKFETAEPKTKQIHDFLRRLKSENALILLKEKNDLIQRACRNLRGAKLLYLESLNVHDLLRFKKVIVPKEVLKNLEEVLSWS
jgi:large subunit ribosomal protein L4